MCCPSFKVFYTFIQNSSYHSQTHWIEKRFLTSKFSKDLVPWNIKSCRFFLHKWFNVIFQIWDCLFIDFDSLLARWLRFDICTKATYNNYLYINSHKELWWWTNTMDTWKWIFERSQHKQINFLETKILKAQIQTCQSFINKVQLAH
jgi:hypothetical protein